MKTEFLKGLGLDQTVIDQIMAENGRDVEAEKARTAAKDGELLKANDTIKNLQEMMKRYDGKDPEKLEKDLADLQKKYDDDVKAEQTKAENLQKEFSLKEALKEIGVLDPDYLVFKHGGIEKFAFSDGKPVGLEDITKPYKETAPHLFKEEEQKETTVTVNSGGEHKPGKVNTTPESLKSALADFYK